MANFDNSHVTALTALINDAVQDVIAEYAAVGQAIPSLNSLKPGPFQVPAETPARLMKAIKIIEAACAQLTYTVSPPGSVMLNHGEAACLSVVTEARIADLLLDQPAGLPASKLADIAGIHAGKLTRILRLLATKHCFKEGETDDGLLASAYLNKTMSKDDNGIPYQRATGFPYFDFDSQFWVKQHPSAVQKERVKFVPFDFFKDAPVQGCDIYYVRRILQILKLTN
ncbi:hypothetical protein HHX47_DHR1000114 [Lentinula edodes]|nr:hypothetical protein HHX47_DHR1000114 [Lentinula edodes]